VVLLLAKDEWLSDLFDIRDNFRRALDAEALIEDDAAGEFREGIELIDSQIRSILEREGVEEIDTSGEVDPTKHRIVKTVSTAEAEPGEIVDVYQLGYQQDDRVLREAQVVVAEELPADERAGPNDDDSRINRGDDAA
jgi:molecular chaperone GrpE